MHTQSACANHNYAETRQSRCNAQPKFYLRIMLALCLMLFSTYYAQNYASIIGTDLDTLKCTRSTRHNNCLMSADSLQ